MERPFEGWLVVDMDGLAWYVRGYEHPLDGLIVTPYRARGSRAERIYLECVGREVDVLLNRDIAKVIDPSRAIKAQHIDERLMELIDHLAPEWVGLTGSRALGTAGASSDYDILIYSPKPLELYRALRDLKMSGVISECSWEMRKRKVIESFDEVTFRYLHSLKALDSCYKGVPYTLRILRQFGGGECRSSYRTLGVIEAAGVINDVGEGFLVPARYKVIVNGGLKASLLTWRTRYQELPASTYYLRGLVQEAAGETIIEPDIDGYIRPTRSWESYS